MTPITYAQSWSHVRYPTGSKSPGLYISPNYACADPESFARGVQLWRGFSDNEGERIQIPLKLGHHRPASETPFKWRLAGGQIMAEHWMLAWFFRGSGPVLLKTLYFCNFSEVGGGGGGRTPCPLSESAHAMCMQAVEDSDEIVHLHKLVWALASHICDKYQNLICCLSYF